MKARVLSLDSDEHRAAQELLPWFVNGTLDAAEAAAVERHLAHCSRCHADAADQAELRAASWHAQSRADVDRDWAALRGRLDAIPAPPARAPASSARRGWTQWLPLTVALQGVALLVLTLVLIAPRDDPYRALGTPPAAADANAVVVFRGDASNQQMRDALRVAGARIVGGPTVTDAYLLRFSDASPQSLARLRAQPGVVKVEALQRAEPR